jgi:prepilin-type N-terminal cleavage/methylation domain-containing protein
MNKTPTSRHPAHNRWRTGFTLVELLVVIAIIGILIGMLLPSVQSVREAARRATCMNNQRQLAIGLHNYESAYMKFPIGASSVNGLCWRVWVLPFIEQNNLYDLFSFEAGPWNGGPNREGPNKMVHALNKISIFNCPTHVTDIAINGSSTLVDGRRTFTSDYHGVAGPKGFGPFGTPYEVQATPAGQGGFALQGTLTRNLAFRMGDFHDGTSNTFAIGEIAIFWNGQVLGSDGADWVRGIGFENGMASCRNVQNGINVPYNGVYNDISFSSLHPGGVVFGRTDGSTSYVVSQIDLSILKSLSSRNGGELNVYYE